MILSALVSLICMGLRCVMSSYCQRYISSGRYIQIVFFADCAMGLLYLLLYGFNVIHIDFYWDSILLLAIGSFINAFGESTLALGLATGVCGSVVSIAGFSSVLISIINWIVDGMSMTGTQTGSIVVSFLGVITISVGDECLLKLKRVLKRKFGSAGGNLERQTLKQQKPFNARPLL